MGKPEWQKLVERAEEVQRQAEELRIQEKNAALPQVRHMVQLYGITPDELFPRQRRGPTRKRARRS